MLLNFFKHTRRSFSLGPPSSSLVRYTNGELDEKQAADRFTVIGKYIVEFHIPKRTALHDIICKTTAPQN